MCGGRRFDSLAVAGVALFVRRRKVSLSVSIEAVSVRLSC